MVVSVLAQSGEIEATVKKEKKENEGGCVCCVAQNRNALLVGRL